MSVCILSDGLDHSVTAVHTFTKRLMALDEVQRRMKNIS
jgi:hypothetical protein